MLALTQALKIYMCQKPIDMRCGIDGLVKLAQIELGGNIFCGNIFVFLSKDKSRAKILQYSNGGFMLFYKRLERGCFFAPKLSSDQTAVILEGWQLLALLDGVSVLKTKRSKLWNPLILQGGGDKNNIICFN